MELKNIIMDTIAAYWETGSAEGWLPMGFKEIPTYGWDLFGKVHFRREGEPFASDELSLGQRDNGDWVVNGMRFRNGDERKVIDYVLDYLGDLS